jgi:hypothetical protein
VNDLADPVRRCCPIRLLRIYFQQPDSPGHGSPGPHSSLLRWRRPAREIVANVSSFAGCWLSYNKISQSFAVCSSIADDIDISFAPSINRLTEQQGRLARRLHQTDHALSAFQE